MCSPKRPILCNISLSIRIRRWWSLDNRPLLSAFSKNCRVKFHFESVGIQMAGHYSQCPILLRKLWCINLINLKCHRLALLFPAASELDLEISAIRSSAVAKITYKASASTNQIMCLESTQIKLVIYHLKFQQGMYQLAACTLPANLKHETKQKLKWPNVQQK